MHGKIIWSRLLQPDGTARVLLYVEDDVHDVELIALALAEAKSTLQMEVVADGASAIAYLSGMGKYANRGRFPMPAIILLDLTLRGLNGFEVLRWMQHEPKGTMPPVIIFSYSKQPVDVQRAAELGANCFISKPMAPEGAVALIRSMEDFLNETRPCPPPVLSSPAPDYGTVAPSPLNPS